MSEKSDKHYENNTDFIKIIMENEAFMNEVEYYYNVRKGLMVAYILATVLINISVCLIGISNEYFALISVWILLFPISILLCIGFWDKIESYENELNDYRKATVIFKQGKLRKVELNKNKLIFHFEKDDGTIKEKTFDCFTFDYSPRINKDQIEIDMRKRKIQISGKYLLD